MTEASAATRHVHASMITLDGVLEELLETVRKQHEAIVNFATLGHQRTEPRTTSKSGA